MGALSETTMRELPEPSVISKDNHMFALVDNNCFMYEVQAIMSTVRVKSRAEITVPPRFLIIIRDDLRFGGTYTAGAADTLEGLWKKYAWAKEVYPWALYEVIF